MFNIRVLKSRGNIFDISKCDRIKDLYSDDSLFKVNPVAVTADPFLFVHKEELYLFFEEQLLSGNGVIKMIKTSDLKIWTNPTTVLEEDFHLSYPFVFMHKGIVYMIPETYQSESIRLYVANEDLTNWSLERTLLEGGEYVDSSILIHHRVYYLFTTINDILYLYYSDRFEGEFIQHPLSPICKGLDKARCGGAIFKYNNEIYRPVQYGMKYYGESLAIYKIVELTKGSYKEEMFMDDVLPKDIPFYKRGGHHFNFTYFKNETVIATDGIKFVLRITVLINRILHKIFKQR